jgi:hypothetical protein
MSRALIAIGLLLVAIGLLWPWLRRVPIGRLPGDLVFHVGRTTVYVPLATMLIVSVVLGLLLWWLRR